MASPLDFKLIVGGQYELLNKLGVGSFGVVYRGVNKGNGQEVAVKFEKPKIRNSHFENECEVYGLLQRGGGSELIPHLWWFGQENGHNVLVMDLMGPNLAHYFRRCSNRFSLKTVLMLAEQMIDAIEYCHTKGVICCDIHSANFLMGIGPRSHKVHLIDFGLAKRYRDPLTGEHIPCPEKTLFAGNYMYASINTHRKNAASRRDDLESLGYLLLHYYRGSLPWSFKMGATKEQISNMIELKLNTSIEKLCRHCPGEFAAFLNHCRALNFTQAPDYEYLRRILSILFQTLYPEFDYVYDWTVIAQDQK